MTERRSKMTGRTALASLAVMPLLVAGPAYAAPAPRGSEIGQQAPAPAPIEAEVTLIHATNDADAGVDPRIGKMPNLGNYRSYQLLSRTNVSLKKAVPTTTTLPNGRVLQITLKDVKDRQFIIDTSINQPDGSV